ncbi:hypothetical protein NEOLEDRAFT_656771 [Neolentinus lepideus HHB14362 ss-1]|uniref:Uncharacterized protein n=1 Tax=Neolentinus lepideus HHB14362 ss-1 TaxID=1314782 RepID=A0A165QFT2_9AGAM|nr:hypothetical protein NEOLEDRAFT_656771 [Neolentinus lepideus HHB14362 ss-1]
MPHVYMPSLHMPHLFSSAPKDEKCRTSWTVFEPWHTEAIKPGRDEKPLPIEYTYRSRRPHRLSVVDADKRDLRLQLFVDGKSLGITTAIELDKSVDCGTNLNMCLEQKFSAGVIEVPRGRHTVRIEWAGDGECIHIDVRLWGDVDNWILVTRFHPWYEGH